MQTSIAAPTSLATTRGTEPEVLAAIESGEGQPIRYAFGSTPSFDARPLMVLGAVAGVGLVSALLSGLGRRG